MRGGVSQGVGNNLQLSDSLTAQGLDPGVGYSPTIPPTTTPFPSRITQGLGPDTPGYAPMQSGVPDICPCP